MHSRGRIVLLQLLIETCSFQFLCGKLESKVKRNIVETALSLNYRRLAAKTE